MRKFGVLVGIVLVAVPLMAMGQQSFDTPGSGSNSAGKQTVRNVPGQGTVVNDGTYDRVLIGYDKDGFSTGSDWGFKVSKPGYDVMTTAAENLAMSSAFNHFKIRQSGHVTLSKGASTTTASSTISITVESLNRIPHVVGFVSPRNFVLLTNGGFNQYKQVPFLVFDTNGALNERADIETTLASDGLSMTVRFVAETPNIAGNIAYTTGEDYDFAYYVLEEVANS